MEILLVLVDWLALVRAGHALGISRPVAPAHGFGNGAGVVVAGKFKFFFKGVEHFEEQEPGELRDSLRVAIDPAVLPHDVLDGFDDA